MIGTMERLILVQNLSPMFRLDEKSISIFIRVIALDLVRIGDEHAKVSTTVSKILPHPRYQIK